MSPACAWPATPPPSPWASGGPAPQRPPRDGRTGVPPADRLDFVAKVLRIFLASRLLYTETAKGRSSVLGANAGCHVVRSMPAAIRHRHPTSGPRAGGHH